MDLKLESVPVVANACFILHNFCEKNKSYIDEDLVRAQWHCMRSNKEMHKNNNSSLIKLNDLQGL